MYTQGEEQGTVSKKENEMEREKKKMSAENKHSSNCIIAEDRCALNSAAEVK